MKWSDWPELIPDPRQIDASGGIRLLAPRGTSPAIQRRLRAFGRRQRDARRRSSLRQRLRLAAGLLVLAALVLVGRRG